MKVSVFLLLKMYSKSLIPQLLDSADLQSVPTYIFKINLTKQLR